MWVNYKQANRKKETKEKKKKFAVEYVEEHSS